MLQRAENAGALHWSSFARAFGRASTPDDHSAGAEALPNGPLVFEFFPSK
jgi:hypothetical protein